MTIVAGASCSHQRTGKQLVQVGVAGPRAADCGHCHVKQYEEWSESLHATAYLNDTFRESTDDYQFQQCLGCHAPDTVFSDGPLQVRARRLAEGVTCTTCHLFEGKLVGPISATALVKPHPIGTKIATYRKSEFCGRCHEGTYQEWRQAPESELSPKKTCQECHMPAVDRTLTEATDVFSRVLVSFEEVTRQRRHTFHVREMAGFADLLDIRANVDGGVARVELVNRLPHAVPTGDFGFRRANIVIETLDADGHILAQRERDLYKQLKSGLGPAQTLVMEIPWPAHAERLRVTLARQGRHQTRHVQLMVKELRP